MCTKLPLIFNVSLDELEDDSDVMLFRFRSSGVLSSTLSSFVRSAKAALLRGEDPAASLSSAERTWNRERGYNNKQNVINTWLCSQHFLVLDRKTIIAAIHTTYAVVLFCRVLFPLLNLYRFNAICRLNVQSTKLFKARHSRKAAF